MSDVSAALPSVLIDYVQDTEPTNPQEGETWFETDTDELKIWTGTQWKLSGVLQHNALTGVSPDDHHTRYSDAEASAAAPVQDVNGQTGSVSVTAPIPVVSSISWSDTPLAEYAAEVSSSAFGPSYSWVNTGITRTADLTGHAYARGEWEIHGGGGSGTDVGARWQAQDGTLTLSATTTDPASYTVIADEADISSLSGTKTFELHIYGTSSAEPIYLRNNRVERPMYSADIA